jgi:hypothetical protein
LLCIVSPAVADATRPGGRVDPRNKFRSQSLLAVVIAYRNVFLPDLFGWAHPVADAIRLTASRALSDVVATTSKPRSNLKMENGMTAIAKVFWRVFPRASSDSGPLVTIALLCGIGLLASLCLATYGLDLSAGEY